MRLRLKVLSVVALLMNVDFNVSVSDDASHQKKETHSMSQRCFFKVIGLAIGAWLI